MSEIYETRAIQRRQAINKYLWDEQQQFYMDYNIKKGTTTGVLSMAAVYPLYFKVANSEQANLVKEKLENSFLKPGGFVTTLQSTGQQWDAPNGWAPLQWLAVQGLKNYGYDELASTAGERWLARNREVYQATGKMMEKYDVINTDLLAGGGEYPLQDGFGWTNGVALALLDLLEK